MGEPLYQDVESVIRRNRPQVQVVGGRYGLASKDTTPGQIAAVFNNLDQAQPKDNFTIGIVDDVTFTSLPTVDLDIPKEGETSCKIWGIGGDGTVGANKNTITTIGLAAGMYAQAYFSYDSKKSGGLTQSHLRFGKNPILATYSVEHADFVALHEPSYLGTYDVTADLKDNGTFLLNCSWSSEEIPAHLPAKMKRDLASKHANMYVIDASRIAREIGLGNRTNTVLQAAFFKLTNIIPLDLAVKEMTTAIYNSYFKKAGQAVVDMNNEAVERGIAGVEKFDIPAEWADAQDAPAAEEQIPGFIRDIVVPMMVERFAGYRRQSYGGCKVGVGDVVIGAAALAAEYNGVEKASAVKDKLIEMTHLNETLYCCGIACSSQGVPTRAGNYQIDLLLANVCKQNVTRFPYEIVRLAEDIAGGLMVTMMLEGDDKATCDKLAGILADKHII